MNSAGLFFIGIFALMFIAFKFAQYKLFEKAGKPGWTALVPVYGNYIWLEIIGKPIWWLILLYVPVLGILVLVSMMIELAKAFGKYDLKHHAASLVLFFYFFPKLALDEKAKYLGPPHEHKNVPLKSNMREWGDAFLFAGVAALIIRTFFIEAFMIPTSSMERTLMAGDFLFVSKFHYGSRMPMMPLSVPFVHNKVSVGKVTVPSYLDVIRLPYFRMPGLSDVERNDIVVFNYPAHDIHDLGDGAGKVEPISMKENYIKRCVAVAGDKLEIKDQQIYINDEVGENPENMQFQYMMQTDPQKNFIQRKNSKNGQEWSFKDMTELGFRKNILNRGGSIITENPNWYPVGRQDNTYYLYTTPKVVEKLRTFDGVQRIDTIYSKKGIANPGNKIYPSKWNSDHKAFKHNIDNFGPIIIPAKGMTVLLKSDNANEDLRNLSLYYRVITAYEGHTLEIRNDQVYIDGKKVTEYTFEMDYYFMMGDNRHNSEDSRIWGFVPENHIVGKPLFVFFSYESNFGIRWGRIGTKYVH